MKKEPKIGQRCRIAYQQGFKEGMKEENKAWRENKRCELCGKPKKAVSISLCNDCLENA